MYMDGLKVFVKDEKEPDTDTTNRNIQSGYRNGS